MSGRPPGWAEIVAGFLAQLRGDGPEAIDGALGGVAGRLERGEISSYKVFFADVRKVCGSKFVPLDRQPELLGRCRRAETSIARLQRHSLAKSAARRAEGKRPALSSVRIVSGDDRVICSATETGKRRTKRRASRSAGSSGTGRPMARQSPSKRPRIDTQLVLGPRQTLAAEAAQMQLPDLEGQHVRVSRAGETQRVYASAYTTTGLFRSLNQDRFSLHCSSQSGAPLVGVFDGHGSLGHAAAAVCARMLPNALLSKSKVQIAGSQPLENVARIKMHVEAAYASVNQTLLDVASAEREFVRKLKSSRARAVNDMDYGTTATVAYVIEQQVVGSAHRTLCVSWIGDSACVVLERPAASSALKGGWSIVFQTRDHNCHDSQEMAAVVARGGRVQDCDGDLRVYPSGMNFSEARRRRLTLNMSRSLGHVVLGQRAGVSAVPEVQLVPLRKGREYAVVIASDGLWDVFDRRDIVRLSANDVSDLALSLVRVAVARMKACADSNKDDVPAGDNVTVASLKIPSV